MDDIRSALYASKMASYSQGFDLLARASEEYDYGTDLAEVGRIWKAGCIIRARFLDRVREAFSVKGEGGQFAPSLLVLAPSFRAELADRVPRWRRVVAAGLQTLETCARKCDQAGGSMCRLCWQRATMVTRATSSCGSTNPSITFIYSWIVLC